MSEESMVNSEKIWCPLLFLLPYSLFTILCFIGKGAYKEDRPLSPLRGQLPLGRGAYKEELL